MAKVPMKLEMWVLVKPGEPRFFVQPRPYSEEFIAIQRKNGYKVLCITKTLPAEFDLDADAVLEI